MRAQDGHGFTNINVTPTFNLIGGEYGVTVTATFDSGTITLQRLADDGVTYVPVNIPGKVSTPAAWTANGMIEVQVPAGAYRLSIPSNTAAATISSNVATVGTDMTNTDANAVITGDTTAAADRAVVDADWTALKAAITAGNWGAAQSAVATMLTDVATLLATTAVQGDNTTKTLVTLLQTDTTTLQGHLAAPSAVSASIVRVPGE